MRKRLIPLIALLMILAVVAVAYSVAISLGSGDIDQLGATDKVSVSCPVSGPPCKIDRVKWVITTSAPYMVDKVQVYWTPADSSKTYNVCVELYTDDEGTPRSSGCSSSYSGGYTEVTVSSIDPKDVDKVRIVIVET
jgi:hypothetical protein